MGRKVGFFEAIHRAGLKTQEREEAAAIRGQERVRALHLKQQERELVRKEREADRHQKFFDRKREREEKDKEKAEKIEQVRATVQAFEWYLEKLVSLHKFKSTPIEVIAEFVERLKPRELPKNEFLGVEPPEYKCKEFQLIDLNPSELRARYSHAFLWIPWCSSILVAAPIGYWLSVSYFPHLGISVFFVMSLISFLYYKSNRERFVVDAFGKFENEQESKKKDFEKKEKENSEDSLRHREGFKKARDRFLLEEANLQTQFGENEKARLGLLNAAKTGEKEAIGSLLEALLPLEFNGVCSDYSISSPSEYEIGYIVKDEFLVELHIHLPSRELIPEKGVALNSQGNGTKIRTLGVREREEIYHSFAASFVLCHVLEVFQALPFTKLITVVASCEYTDPKTGKDYWLPEVAGHFAVSKLKEIVFTRAEALPALDNFEMVMLFPEKKKRVDGSQIPTDEDAVWATVNDEDLGLPYGILPGQVEIALENKFAHWP